jgi:hypothetical protein
MTGALLANGFEAALIGVGTQFNTDVAVYDFQDCINVLIERDGMMPEDAYEYMDFNVTGAYVGENTPVFLHYRSLRDYLISEGYEQEDDQTGQPGLGGGGGSNADTSGSHEVDR